MRSLLFIVCSAAVTASASSGKIGGKVVAEVAADQHVVFVETAPQARAKKQRVELAQYGTKFTPPIVVIGVGDTVDFPNKDKFYHNVFSQTPGHQFDLGLYRSGISKSVAFSKAGEVDVYCNIHPDMAAKILVLPNDWWAKTEADGSFTISDVPVGTYTVVAWSPQHQMAKREVTVKAGQAAAVSFEVQRRVQGAGHLNKHGERYGSY